MTGRWRILTALAATCGLGLLFLGGLGLLAWLGAVIEVSRPAITPLTATSGLGAMALLWCALAVLVHEILAARDDARVRGTAVPALLGGLLTVTALAFFVLLYRGLYYGLLLLGWRDAATTLTDPLVLAAINAIVLLFALGNLLLVAHAPVRALIRATAARWRRRRAGGAKSGGGVE